MLKFAILLVNNNRSKSYLQNLINHGFVPTMAIVLNDRNVNLVEQTENDKLISKNTDQNFFRKLKDIDLSFNEKEHILTTLDNNKIDYSLLDTLDVNSELVIKEVSKISDDYIIYSGPSGTILRKEILSLGKKFIHVHPGHLPRYRGSTTIYYSILDDLTVGCSVILLNEGIDEGPILYKNKYKIKEKNLDFDYVLDPLIRTKILIEFLSLNKITPEHQDKNEEINTFYIIHPFLKHLSIAKYNKEINKNEKSI